MNMLRRNALNRYLKMGIILVVISIAVSCTQQNSPDSERAIAKKEIIYSVPAMHCDGCVRSITDALNSLPGMDSVHVELASYTAYVRVDTTQSDASTIASTIDALGCTATRK